MCVFVCECIGGQYRFSPPLSLSRSGRMEALCASIHSLVCAPRDRQTDLRLLASFLCFLARIRPGRPLQPSIRLFFFFLFPLTYTHTHTHTHTHTPSLCLCVLSIAALTSIAGSTESRATVQRRYSSRAGQPEHDSPACSGDWRAPCGRGGAAVRVDHALSRPARRRDRSGLDKRRRQGRRVCACVLSRACCVCLTL
jgi:hypothetical protein